MECKIEEAHKEISSRQYLHMRIQSILTSLVTSESASIYTENVNKDCHKLIAVFDQGIDPDPNFSGGVNGSIYLDEKKNLCLKIWPTLKKEDKKVPYRKEVLCSHVEKFQFQFFSKKEKSTADEYEWRSEWPKQSAIPTMIRLLIWKENEKRVDYAFLLPMAEERIRYEEKQVS